MLFIAIVVFIIFDAQDESGDEDFDPSKPNAEQDGSDAGCATIAALWGMHHKFNELIKD